jgi:hypothetical protein
MLIAKFRLSKIYNGASKMFIRDTNLIIEANIQESYASVTRKDDAIKQGLSALIEDLSLSGETTGDFEIADWIN